MKDPTIRVLAELIPCYCASSEYRLEIRVRASGEERCVTTIIHRDDVMSGSLFEYMVRDACDRIVENVRKSTGRPTLSEQLERAKGDLRRAKKRIENAKGALE